VAHYPFHPFNCTPKDPKFKKITGDETTFLHTKNGMKLVSFQKFMATKRKYQGWCCVPDENIKLENSLEKHPLARQQLEHSTEIRIHNLTPVAPLWIYCAIKQNNLLL
jgi:hypothetical protein